MAKSQAGRQLFATGEFIKKPGHHQRSSSTTECPHGPWPSTTVWWPMAQNQFRELSPPGSGDDKRGGVWVRIGGREMYGYWEPASPSPDRAVFRFLNRLPAALWPRTEPTTSAESAALLPPIAATWQYVVPSVSRA